MNRGCGGCCALFASAGVGLACVVRHCQRVSRDSVCPRTCWAFSAKLDARYGVAFSVLQAAKRDGGGILVALVLAGCRAVIIWRPYCGRQCRKSHLHSVWLLGEKVARQGGGERVVREVSREGGQAKRNLGLARARRLLRSALVVSAREFHWVPFGPVPAGFFGKA